MPKPLARLLARPKAESGLRRRRGLAPRTRRRGWPFSEVSTLAGGLFSPARLSHCPGKTVVEHGSFTRACCEVAKRLRQHRRLILWGWRKQRTSLGLSDFEGKWTSWSIPLLSRIQKCAREGDHQRASHHRCQHQQWATQGSTTSGQQSASTDSGVRDSEKDWSARAPGADPSLADGQGRAAHVAAEEQGA